MNVGREDIPFTRTPVGSSRAAIISGLGITYAFLPFVVIPPFVLALFNQNPFWLVLLAPLTFWARKVGSDDPNKPRRWWLSVRGGSYFADRSRTGCEEIPCGRSRGTIAGGLYG